MIHQPLFSLHAFVQLTGDLSISARGGRIYLPQDELARFGLSDDDIFTGKVTDKWRSFMKNQIRRARMFFRTAEDGVTELDQASRSTCFFDFVTVIAMNYLPLPDAGLGFSAVASADPRRDRFTKRASASNAKKLMALIVDMIDSAAIDAWVRKLKDVMYDADDVMDLCMMEGGRLLEAPQYTHQVEKMDEESGWRLLRGIVFEAGEEAEIAGLADVGTRIVEMCDGLPLAIKAMGGVLIPKERTKAEWENILRSDAWSMNPTDEELPRALFLSYEDLPPHLKQCFLYCSLYPEKSDLYYQEIVRLWVAEGLILKQGDRLVEDSAEEYYRELVGRSLLQVNPSYADHSYFSMHDLYRTLGANLMQEEGVSIVHGGTFTTNTNTKIRRLSVSKMGRRLELADEVNETQVFEENCSEVYHICECWI
ncbi:hypothetical protein GW17_00024260 [Ensete ventricosum]|nr:hypothetical protein GW17_00024260 [Ensete ventricosum]